MTAGRAAGNEIQAPMGVVILGGLLSWGRAPERAPPRVRSSHDGARFRGTRSGRPPIGDLPAERDEFVDKIWSRSFRRWGDFGQVQSYGPVIDAESGEICASRPSG